MAKDTDTQGPEGTPEVVTIETVEALESMYIEDPAALKAAYPDLCQALADTLLAEVAKMSAAQAREAFPDLAVKLSVVDAAGLDPKKGFVLAIGDPFAAGVERVFARATKAAPRPLPCALPYKNPATKEALASYVVRAEGAGDIVRTANGKLGLGRCKK